MVASVLNRPTLVLNRSWQPIDVVRVSRALVKVWGGVARIVDPEDYRLYDWHDWRDLEPAPGMPAIRTPCFSLRVPEVIALVVCDKIPTGVVSFSRRNIFRRDQYRCQYCSKKLGGEELTVDHVIPRSQGGVSSWENCVLACVDCNKRKADKTPEQARMPLLKKPIRPQWSPRYVSHVKPVDSWAKFVSEAYWSSELEP